VQALDRVGGLLYRAVLVHAPILRLALRLAPVAALVLTTLPLAAARAQDEERPGERPGGSDYAWRADEAAGASNPSRILLTVGAGSSLRIVKNITYEQDIFAPAFVDVFGAFVFPSSAGWRHGVGLAVSTNITGDGGSTNGVNGFSQYFLGPEYVAYFRLSDDFVLDAHAGPLFGWSQNSEGGSFDPIVGLEVAFSAAYLFLAGLGAYAEASASAYLGGNNTVHPILSIEGGLFIDYEVLP